MPIFVNRGVRAHLLQQGVSRRWSGAGRRTRTPAPAPAVSPPASQLGSKTQFPYPYNGMTKTFWT